MPRQVLVAGLVYEGSPRSRSSIFLYRRGAPRSLISSLELRLPRRALALRRGRPDSRVASSSLLSLLIPATLVLTTHAVLPYGVLRPWADAC